MYMPVVLWLVYLHNLTIRKSFTTEINTLARQFVVNIPAAIAAINYSC